MPLAIWNYETVPGQGWIYDDESVSYDSYLDTAQLLPVYYDRLGDTTVWTNETI